EIIDVVENKKEDLRTYIQQTKSKILSLAISGKLVTQNPNDEPAIELLRRINPSFVFCDTSHYGNFPDTWCGAKLNDLGVSILNGFAFQSKKYTPFGVKVIRITNVQDGYISDSDPKFYPDSEEISRYKLKENDLLMSLTGNVGRVGFLPKSMLPAALNQRVACLRTTENIVLKKYLFYFLLSETFKEDCIISGKGVAQLNVSTEWLKQYIMPLPPISEQSRIVKRVEEVFGVLDVISTEL
ncbi:MAG: restriction endonuclease subunit S, partial [Paludibacteraceae bacterium]|nr:restriction endonuclease subunit S [Paludibacteraceae bacterium]